MYLDYPRAFSEIQDWSDENGVPISEGRVRFAQYRVMCAIVRSRRLRDILVFKGGNALDFIWHPNRSTVDLDFSLDINIVKDRLNVTITPEDIIAEKLRALLQQPIRKRYRPQDLLDIAILLAANHILDPQRIADFLQRKAAARNISVSRAAFRTPEILSRTRTGYNALEVTTRKQFIAFDETHTTLLAFVDTLPIPEDAI